MSINANDHTTTISVHKAAMSLGLRNNDIVDLIAELNIPKSRNNKGKWAIFTQDFMVLKNVMKEKRKAEKKVQLDEQKEFQKNVAHVAKYQQELNDNVQVNIKMRSRPLLSSVLYVGPTNSGKTYHGLEQLFSDYESNPDELHVYCGPLRLLAFEVYNKMVDRFGEANVGFITGEEAINPNAKLLATTAEMAPKSGRSILIDEAHWLAEPSRGHVWTRLLMSSEYENIYSLTASEAVPLIQKLTSDAEYSNINVFTRKTPIVFKGSMDIVKVPKKTAIVCFSRKTVYTVAHYLQKQGIKVGVLYGGLPLKARKRQIEAYIDGKYDVMVVTDVIGHGINLPIDNVVFTQTEKFDGTDVRPLYVWEAAQIAGRAGRFGLSEEGSVYLAEGLPWFSKDRELVREAVLAAGGKIGTDLDVETALIAPTLHDLGLSLDNENIEELTKLLPAIYQWQIKAFNLFDNNLTERLVVPERFDYKNVGVCLEPSVLAMLIRNMLTILSTLNIPLAPWNESYLLHSENLPKDLTVDINELWQLASGPYDSELQSVQEIAHWLANPYRSETRQLESFFNKSVNMWVKIAENNPIMSQITEHIESMEKAIQVNAELKMAMVMFGVGEVGLRTLGTLHETQLIDAENIINDAIIRILAVSIKHSTHGVCENCAEVTYPWFKLCDTCYNDR